MRFYTEWQTFDKGYLWNRFMIERFVKGLICLAAILEHARIFAYSAVVFAYSANHFRLFGEAAVFALLAAFCSVQFSNIFCC